MNHILGHTIAGIYVVEFQKHGLPHAHILICKPHTVEDVDRMINAELPNSKTNKLAHKTVARCMMHGPCGVAFPNAPCMEEDKCKKQYPRKFQSETVKDVNGYPIYQLRNTGHTILVHGIELDNRWVVPHNVYLSTKYDAHISVELAVKLASDANPKLGMKFMGENQIWSPPKPFFLPCVLFSS
jgi:hypothetical protein